MRKHAVCAALSATLALFLFSTSAMSDICALKSGDYDTTNNTPCTNEDGDGDDVIDLIFNIGDITVDIVYQQEGTPYDIWLYNYLLMYDGDGGEVMSGASFTCDPNLTYFDTQLGNGYGLPECTKPQGGDAGEAEDNSGNLIVGASANNFNTPSSFPDPYPPYFVLDTITMPNTYTTPSADHVAGSEKWTFGFSIDYNSPTNIVLQDGADQCYVMTDLLGTCGGMSIDLQTRLTSRVFMDEVPCFVGPPGAASVSSCNYSGDGTCADGEEAEATLSLTIPNSCYSDATCTTTSTDCGTYGLRVDRTDGGTVNLDDDLTGTAGSVVTFSDTTPLIGETPTYTITAVDNDETCQASSATTCTNATRNIAASDACACGVSPTITLSNPSQTEINEMVASAETVCTNCKTFIEKADISIKYNITDTDGTLPGSISKIYFFYTIDTSVAPVVEEYDSTDISNSAITIKIPKAYVTSAADIYFGVTIMDEQNLTGEYPTDFTCDPTTPGTSCFDTVYSKILKEYIIPGTRCAFVDGDEPYPNMFPFMLSGQSVGSEGNILKLFFVMNEVSNVSMRLYTLDGMLVRQIEDNSTKVQLPGEGETCIGEGCNFCNWESGCQWDGTTYKGGNDLVANGMYIVNIHAVCTGDNFSGQSVDYTKGIVVMK